MTSDASGVVMAPPSNAVPPGPDLEESEEYFDDQWDDEEDTSVFETMDDTPNKIQHGLYISGFLAEQNKAKLQSNSITHIVQAAEGLSPSHPGDFQYLSVPVLDASSENLAQHFQEVFEFIDQAMEQRGSVLVHCVAGVSRSATLCIGFLMWKHRITYQEAFRRVHAARPWVMPNLGFRGQLLRFEILGCDIGKLQESLNAEHANGGTHGSDESDGPTASGKEPVDKLCRELTDLDLIMPQRSARSEGFHSFLFNTVGPDSSARHNGIRSAKDKSSTYIPELGTSF